MFEIAVELSFDAAHFLRGYGGKCEALHGHRFRVVAKVKAPAVNDIGIAYDFADLKSHLGKVLSRFDHTLLNEIEPFDRVNPSSENIAQAVYQALNPLLGGVAVSAVEVWESPGSGVTYCPV